MSTSPGVLYYALTHSPEPLNEEYSYALSWQAATKRLEAAGSIPVKEAEEMAKALSSDDAGIEVGPFLSCSLRQRYLKLITLFFSPFRSPCRP